MLSLENKKSKKHGLWLVTMTVLKFAKLDVRFHIDFTANLMKTRRSQAINSTQHHVFR